jgi:hypothetical protein
LLHGRVHTVTPSEAAASYPVYKRGAMTLYTEGKVDSLDNSGWSENTGGPEARRWTGVNRLWLWPRAAPTQPGAALAASP